MNTPMPNQNYNQQQQGQNSNQGYNQQQSNQNFQQSAGPPQQNNNFQPSGSPQFDGGGSPNAGSSVSQQQTNVEEKMNHLKDIFGRKSRFLVKFSPKT